MHIWGPDQIQKWYPPGREIDFTVPNRQDVLYETIRRTHVLRLVDAIFDSDPMTRCRNCLPKTGAPYGRMEAMWKCFDLIVCQILLTVLL